MTEISFGKVWYRPEKGQWDDRKILAFSDTGVLIVSDNSLTFKGKKEKVQITNIKRITYGKQGKDFINNWIKVEYQDGNTAFLADGNLLGWAGVFGGTKKILKVIQHLAQST